MLCRTLASRFQFELFDYLLVGQCPKDFAILSKLSLHRDCADGLDFCCTIDSLLLQLGESLSLLGFLNLNTANVIERM
jgi:hypothetical protein